MQYLQILKEFPYFIVQVLMQTNLKIYADFAFQQHLLCFSFDSFFIHLKFVATYFNGKWIICNPVIQHNTLNHRSTYHINSGQGNVSSCYYMSLKPKLAPRPIQEIQLNTKPSKKLYLTWKGFHQILKSCIEQNIQVVCQKKS